MARAMATDPLTTFRFHVDATGIGGVQKLGSPQAGFVSCTAPVLTMTPIVYKEGNFVYGRKYAGVPEYNDITLTSGVIRGQSLFFHWALQVAEGSGEYRADVSIKHFHRDTSLLGVEPVRPQGTPNATQMNQDTPAFTYQLFEAVPTSTKFASDFSASDSNISMKELTLAFEYANILELQPA